MSFGDWVVALSPCFTEALPPTEEDEERLWQIDYEDGDSEQLNYEELSKVIVRK